MTCVRLGPNTIACVSPWGRLKVQGKYVWVDFHPYCGPTFYKDSKMRVLYEPSDENDPVWEEFRKWHEKYKKANAKGRPNA